MKFLFERLETTGQPFDLKLAVLNNLQRLVSSREAFMGTKPDLHESKATASFDVLNCAMPSVVEIGSCGRLALEAYGGRLQALISHYEPRLRAPRISIEVADSTPWRLIVSGLLETSGGPQALRFPVDLRAEG